MSERLSAEEMTTLEELPEGTLVRVDDRVEGHRFSALLSRVGEDGRLVLDNGKTVKPSPWAKLKKTANGYTYQSPVFGTLEFVLPH